MTGPPLPVPPPVVNPESRPYWEATAEGRLVLQRCDSCQAVVWYPRAMCPECSGSGLRWFEASGVGTVYSFTINRRGEGPYREAGPYVLAYVELEEGPRVLTNIVDCDIDQLAIGRRVRAVFHDTGQGTALVRFRPS